jgi:broad specificity phosphatase PhoE
MGRTSLRYLRWVIPRTVYLARHGETDWNRQGRWQGHTDIALNDQGRLQAHALGQAVIARGLGRISSSDLARARETAEIVGAVLGLGPVTVDAALRERGFGCFEGLTREECEARYPELWSRYRSNLREVPPGGEPHTDVVPRVHAAMKRAAAALGQTEAALLVSHGAAIRLSIGAITGEVPPPLGNGSLFRVEVDGEDFGAVERVI